MVLRTAAVVVGAGVVLLVGPAAGVAGGLVVVGLALGAAVAAAAFNGVEVVVWRYRRSTWERM